MNRDAKTQSALIALARSRRMQRALSHAHLHRNAPMPTLKSSLGYMTSTACVTGIRSNVSTLRFCSIAEPWQGVGNVTRNDLPIRAIVRKNRLDQLVRLPAIG